MVPQIPPLAGVQPPAQVVNIQQSQSEEDLKQQELDNIQQVERQDQVGIQQQNVQRRSEQPLVAQQPQAVDNQQQQAFIQQNDVQNNIHEQHHHIRAIHAPNPNNNSSDWDWDSETDSESDSDEFDSTDDDVQERQVQQWIQVPVHKNTNTNNYIRVRQQTNTLGLNTDLLATLVLELLKRGLVPNDYCLLEFMKCDLMREQQSRFKVQQRQISCNKIYALNCAAASIFNRYRKLLINNFTKIIKKLQADLRKERADNVKGLLKPLKQFGKDLKQVTDDPIKFMVAMSVLQKHTQDVSRLGPDAYMRSALTKCSRKGWKHQSFTQHLQESGFLSAVTPASIQTQLFFASQKKTKKRKSTEQSTMRDSRMRDSRMCRYKEKCNRKDTCKFRHS